MNDLVSMPVWFLVLMCIFAVVGLTDRIFAPSVKWFFRRKANKAIEELNTRLRLRIQPFKTTRRQALIDRVLFDPEVIKAIEVEAQDTDPPQIYRSILLLSKRRTENGWKAPQTRRDCFEVASG